MVDSDLWYRVNRLFYRVWFTLQFPYRVEGRHNEPRPPYIMIANHASAVDIPLTCLAVRARLVWMAKEELMRNALVRAYVGSFGFFVRRGQPDRVALRAALDLLARGRPIVLFAEGTRSPDGRLRPFEDGAAFLALRAGVRVLPVAIAGSHRIMPRGKIIPRRALVVVRVGEPVAVPKVEGRITRPMMEEWTARFHRIMADLLPPDQRPAPGAVGGASMGSSG